MKRYPPPLDGPPDHLNPVIASREAARQSIFRATPRGRDVSGRMIPKSSILVAAFALAIVKVASASQPLHYDRPVTLSGVISTLQFYGPPDFGERPSTDARETAIILNLDKPMDVIATTFTGPNMDSWHNERRVQLDDFTAPLCLSRLVGRHVTVRGKLYDHVQIFDRTDVVMEVSALIHPAGLNK